MTGITHPRSVSVTDAALYVAFEVGKKSWKVAMTAGLGVTPWVQSMSPGDWTKLRALLTKAQQRFGRGPTTRVVSCYEAGRDGFWIHRGLVLQGLANRVVDSASIEVNRRARRNKSDQLDARKLAELLVRACVGLPAWREVRVPTEAEEAARHVSRERSALVAERTRLLNQVTSWLATRGATRPTRLTATWWATVRDYAGAALPLELQTRVARVDARLALLAAQIADVDRLQAAAIAAAPTASPAGRLRQLKGLGPTSIATLLDEGLVWREFQNRQQVGGFLGFAPVHYASGDQQQDQGISQAGNKRLQAVSVQLAWGWLLWQRESALTKWFTARFHGSQRERRRGIVAVARRLVIALWRYATQGVVPEGAQLKIA